MALNDEIIEIRNKAFTFLARREHGEHELRVKLEAKEFDPVLVDAVLIKLMAENYLSDARYVEMIIRYQHERGQGQNKIRQHLRHNQVDNGLIEQAFNDFEGDWLNSAKAVRLKRFGELSLPNDFEGRSKEKSRQMRFLASRGFESEDIESVFND